MPRVMRKGRAAWLKDDGLSLIELVVAILVLSIGALAASRAADQSARALTGAMPRLLSTIIAENRAEELRAFGANAALPDSVAMNGQLFTVTTRQDATAGGLIQATISVQSEAGQGATLVTYLPPRRLVR